MDTLKRDFQLALRGLAKRPGLSSIAVLTLVLGVAANISIFSIVYGALFRPLGFEQEARLVTVLASSETEGEERVGSSLSDFRFLQEHQSSFERLGFYGWSSMTLERPGGSQNLAGVYIDPELFRTLGLSPVAGRALHGEDAAAGLGSAAWISEAAWRRIWGGDPEILGTEVQIDGRPVEIAGVLREGAELPNHFAEMWVPIGPAQEATQRFGRDERDFVIIGRLADGVTLADSEQEMAAFAERLAEDFPDTNGGWGWRVTTLREHLVGDARRPLWVAFAAVSLVLLLACANITHLLLVRASGRRREMSVRAALGAGRGDLARLVMTESLLLALAGGVFGTIAAVWLHDLVLALEPGILPRTQALAIDGPVLLFALVTSVLAGILCGVLPALYGSDSVASSLLGSALHGSAAPAGLGSRSQAFGGGGFWRRALLGFEVALSLVLLTGAALLGRTLYDLHRVDPGFEARDVYMAYFLLDGAAYDGNPARIRFFERLQREVSALPGVRSASLVTTPPVPGPGIIIDVPYRAEGAAPSSEEETRRAAFRIAAPGYFATAGIPLRAGRDFERADDADSRQVVIVNRSLAARLWSGAEANASAALGKRLEFDFEGQTRQLEVIGVVGDTRFAGLHEPPRPALFVPHAQLPFRGMAVVARSSLPQAAFAEGLRQAAARIDPTVPPASAFSLETALERSYGLERFFAALLGLFALLAVALTAGGIYGVFSFWVSERTQEIGVRMALGAARREVVALIVSQGASVAAWGLLAGAFGAAATFGLIRRAFVGASEASPVALLLVAAALFAVTLGACLVPALRACRIDGAAALRSE